MARSNKVQIKKVKRMALYEAVPRIDGDTVIDDAPDMLRYDHCYASEKYRNVVLCLDRMPTVDRWGTFWFHLNFIGTVKYVEPKEWFTFRHVRGGGDMVRLVMADETDHLERPIRIENVGKGFDFETPADWRKPKP